ncbi:hypothetical protein ACQCX2_07900 [Propionibacteriaceae bacterium Y1700]|uniref:hypothetical protein n=1 Tax=Microlunatus sp. Y1700 TaxID=3418487 RepID=UPI003DA738FC
MENRRLLDVEQQSEHTTWLVLAMIKMIIFGLLLACLFVPLARLTDEDGLSLGRGLFGLIDMISNEAYRFDERAEDRNDVAERVVWTLQMVRVGVVVWCLGLLAVGITTVELIASAQLRDKVFVRLSASVLLLGTILVALGLRWLETFREDELGPAWGLWVPIFLALWVLILHSRANRLGESVRQ